MDKSSDIIVSVIVITYNHEQYIIQALDSILMQKVNFKYEILVGDDCSQDSTAIILRKYQKTYPDKFRICLRKVNIGATKNIYHLIKHARGKYIAMLEGDDYWLSEYKLQKQIDFLDEQQEYMSCSHECVVVDENGIAIPEKNIKNSNNFWCYDQNVFGLKDFSKGKFAGQLGTIMFRNYFTENIKNYNIIYKAHRIIFDRTLSLLLCEKGNVFHMQEGMSCYRYIEKPEASNWQSQARNTNKRYEEFHYIRILEEYAKRHFDPNFNMNEVKKEKLICGTVVFLNQRNFVNFKVMISMVLDSGFTFKYLIIALKTIIMKLYYRNILKEDRPIKL